MNRTTKYYKMIEKLAKWKKFIFFYLLTLVFALSVNILDLEDGVHTDTVLEQITPEQEAENRRVLASTADYKPLSLTTYHCSHIFIFTAGTSEKFWPFSIFRIDGPLGAIPGEHFCDESFSFFGIFGGFGIDEFFIYLIILIFILVWEVVVKQSTQ